MPKPQQLGLFTAPAPPPLTITTGLPASVASVVEASHLLSSTVDELGRRVQIVRGCWGVGLGPKRKWMLTGPCCCAVAAFLVARGLECDPMDNSPRATALRFLHWSSDELNEFLRGFDWLPGRESKWENRETQWFLYGKQAAQDLGVQSLDDALHVYRP